MTIDTNLSGVFNMTHPVWSGMRDRKFGRVVTISSISGFTAQTFPGPPSHWPKPTESVSISQRSIRTG